MVMFQIQQKCFLTPRLRKNTTVPFQARRSASHRRRLRKYALYFWKGVRIVAGPPGLSPITLHVCDDHVPNSDVVSFNNDLDEESIDEAAITNFLWAISSSKADLSDTFQACFYLRKNVEQVQGSTNSYSPVASKVIESSTTDNAADNSAVDKPLSRRQLLISEERLELDLEHRLTYFRNKHDGRKLNILLVHSTTTMT